ncbi:hypothetical protein GGR51DRAFT_561554 [Nemania sp. FL0031]|nr:hypothetical protein GGR51DRAFT_561554 [Nemania sp. FL0031]
MADLPRWREIVPLRRKNHTEPHQDMDQQTGIISEKAAQAARPVHRPESHEAEATFGGLICHFWKDLSSKDLF